MKRAHTFCMCVMVLLHGQLYAQESHLPVNQAKAEKPLLFASLPDRFEVDHDQLLKILSGEINEQFNLQLSGQFWIRGKIVDKSHPNTGNFTVNFRMVNYQSALLNMSAKLLADNSLHIQARILHPRYGDVLILQQEKDKYFFKKQLQKLFMPE